ncbi:MAG: MIP/aquaporin family protein [Akkermansiaceae bacterium]
MKKLLTEFIGSFLFIFTVCLTAVLAGHDLAPIAIGVVLMLMVYAGGPISGGHFNPAVTLAATLRGAHPKAECGTYILSQVAGAVCAAGLAKGVFASEVLKAGTSVEAIKLGSTTAVMASEFIFTFALALVVLCTATSKRSEGNSYFGFAIGATVVVGAITVGSISLGAFNPAITTGLMVIGKLNPADCWMHYLPQLLGGTIAAYTFLFIDSAETE